MQYRFHWLSTVALAVLFAGACNSGGLVPGAEGGMCRRIGQPCDPGLVCESGICAPPGGFGAPDAGPPDADDPDAPVGDTPDAAVPGSIDAASPGAIDAPVGGTPDAAVPGSIDAAVPGPIDAAPPPDGDCDPVAQTGCLPGQQCTGFVTDFGASFDCYPDGSIPVGGACTSTLFGLDDCAGASHCYDGLCRRYCDPDTGAGCSEACLPIADGVGLCLPACDTLDPSCPAGDGCYPYLANAGSGACTSAGTTPVGNLCTYNNECVPGAVCAASTSTCQILCDAATYPGVNDPVRCPSNQVCAPFPSLPDYGTCE